jgi:cell division transport system permease protein
MLFTNIKRAIKAGFINFWRNGWVSLATVLVMLVTLFIVGSLVFLNLLLNSTISRLEEKVDISVYFKTDAMEANIFSLERTLSNLDEVRSVEYVTREESLREFKERHKDNSLINQSLAELDDNPLGASFNIRAKNPNQYASISQFLESKN